MINSTRPQWTSFAKPVILVLDNSIIEKMLTHTNHIHELHRELLRVRLSPSIWIIFKFKIGSNFYIFESGYLTKLLQFQIPFVCLFFYSKLQ